MRSEYARTCRAALVGGVDVDRHTLAPAWIMWLGAADWAEAAKLAKAASARFSAFWVEAYADSYTASCCLENGGEYVVLRVSLGAHDTLPSLAAVYAAADRPERHAHDLCGIRIADARDQRRWIRHRAWGETEFPLRPGFDDRRIPGPTPSDDRYPFVSAQGGGVIEIPVGPVHAGTIEPGHFRFQAVGETVLNLEERLGYVHKGIEKLAEGRDMKALARLAARVSGDSTIAHSWAACQAVERALGVAVPPRALWLRALMAERERVANHIGDIGAICNDVGFSFAQTQFSRLREIWVRESEQIFGHRLMMDRIIPGGVAVDPELGSLRDMALAASRLTNEFAALIERIESSESLEDRLMTTGRLSVEQARQLGALGYVGKASGQSFDVRRNAPYAPYDELDVPVPSYHAGDVAARAKVRADEVSISLHLIAQIVERIPDGATRVDVPLKQCTSEGFGIVEGWRGEIVTFVRIDQTGRVTRFFPRDPSWLIWPALELLIQNNIVPDFPVCNKSVNGSYSGHDL